MLTIKANFRFVSNKLDHVAQQLGVGGKVHHAGHQLWVDCLEGDEPTKRRAWATMRRYNKNDVVITERVYDRIRPWIRNHPHVGMWTKQPVSCAQCGGTDFEQDGLARALLGSYGQFRCLACGSWSRDNARQDGVTLRNVK